MAKSIDFGRNNRESTAQQLEHRVPLDNLYKLDTAVLNHWGYFRFDNLGYITWSDAAGLPCFKVNLAVDVDVHLQVVLSYRVGDKKIEYIVKLSSTNCNFGGKRWWFICPGNPLIGHCGRRVRLLYKNGDYFLCRGCHNLCYSMQNDNHRWSMYGFYRAFLYKKAEHDLEDKIKRMVYAGRLTRKAQRLDYLRRRTAYVFHEWEKNNDVSGKGI